MPWPLFVYIDDFIDQLDFAVADGTERLVILSAETGELTTVSYREADGFLNPIDPWLGGGWPDGAWGWPGPDGIPGTGDGGSGFPGWPDSGTGDPGSDLTPSLPPSAREALWIPASFQLQSTEDPSGSYGAAGIGFPNAATSTASYSFSAPSWGSATPRLIVAGSSASPTYAVMSVQMGVFSGGSVSYSTVNATRVLISEPTFPTRLISADFPSVSLNDDVCVVRVMRLGTASGDTFTGQLSVLGVLLMAP